MYRNIVKLSTVLNLSVVLKLFYNSDNSGVGRTLFARMSVFILFALEIYLQLRVHYELHELPLSELIVWKRIWMTMSVLSLIVLVVGILVHFYALKLGKPQSRVLQASCRLKKSKVGLGWITIASVGVCGSRSGFAAVTLIRLMAAQDAEVSIRVYLSLMLTPWLEMVGHLILAQFSSLLQIVGVVLDEATDGVRGYVVDIRKHSLCLTLMSDLNRVYGWQLFLIFVSVNMQILQSLFFMGINILRLMKPKNGIALRTSAKLDLGLNVMLFSYAGFQLLMMVDSCEKINKKVDAFYKELFRLMRESNTLCSNKKLCLYVSMRKTVNFTACGFFNLGYPLITSIIAAATTYLVILVQFSIPKSN